MPSDSGVVKQQHIGSVAGQDLTLHRCAHSHGFVRVDVATRFFTKKRFDFFLYLRHARHTTDQNRVMNVAGRDAGVLNGSAARRDGALNPTRPGLSSLAQVSLMFG